MEGVSQSASTVRQLPARLVSELEKASDMQRTESTSTLNLSLPSSPRSGALPSPPDSPAGSVSSLPSVTSSFFFSSAAASPGHVLRPLDHHDDNHSEGSHESTARNATRGLIIPSLTLPPALRRSTPYGQTLGEVRLLVLGRQGVDKRSLVRLLLEDNEDIVEAGSWVDPRGEDGEVDEEMNAMAMAGAKVLRASTSWIQHSDRHGLDKFEPARNVEMVELPSYDGATDGTELANTLRSIIRSPFRALTSLLRPDIQPSMLLANMLSSPASPLFTALVFLLQSSPSPLERSIIDSLGGDVPIIVLSPESLPTQITSKLSGFRPSNALSLKDGLFHSPETIGRLRIEAAERFMRWREVERAVDGVVQHRTDETEYFSPRHRPRAGWDKEKWERDWMENLSKDVYVALQDRRQYEPHQRSPLVPNYEEDDADRSHSVTPSSESERPERPASPAPFHPNLLPHSQPFDPLHLPSLLLFAVSILGPLKNRVLDCVKAIAQGYLDDDHPRRAFQARREAGRAEKKTMRMIALGGLVTAGFAVGVGVGAAWSGPK
ncbi:hypothetical protein BKA70DRAFT_1326176 [Coprinopsis sp. MPI-PUGE-AT-0042]|nr:hypothetical protein BKA70DRAFT_1326176 [Coprinopsis sp. MPI-PUGE-AT-0042]